MHVQEIAKKAYKMLGFLMRTCKDYKNIRSTVLLFNFLFKNQLNQGWPTRGPRAACGPKINFCGSIMNKNLLIFRYFECFFTVFVKNWPKKSIFLEIFSDCGPETDLGWPPLS
jgi:hypothetical protein